MDREQYERELKRIQEDHLRQVRENRQSGPWQPCAHDGCHECHGTGVKLDGAPCIHMLYCACPKCCAYSASPTGMWEISSGHTADDRWVVTPVGAEQLSPTSAVY